MGTKRKNPKMQPWVDYLLQDIRQATREIECNESDSWTKESFQQTIEDFDFCDFWSDNPPQSIAQICGMEPELFPTADILSNSQMKHLLESLTEMYESWFITADIPRKAPISKKYTLLTGLLKKVVHVPTSGNIIFDFCTGNPQGCELENFCSCRKFLQRAGVK